jgi:catalase (peroxidase I)
VTPPSTAQLLILVDRAEKGRLTADEVTVLRAGIASLDAARRSAGGLQAALRAIKTIAPTTQPTTPERRHP